MSTTLEVRRACGREYASFVLDGHDEMHNQSQMKCHELRDRISRSAYDVDPRRVATAVIVKLAICGESRPRSGRGGPSRQVVAPHPDRQAT
jgi:hypothetical protein